MQLDYYVDYEVFYKDGSSELKEEAIMARNKDEAIKIVEQVLAKTEDGREINIIDIRQLW